MKHLAIIFICVICIACGDESSLVENNIVKVLSSSSEPLVIKSYTIPHGIFRGVTWPSSEKPNFQIWIIKNMKEVFFLIPSSPETAKWKSRADNDWIIKEGLPSKSIKKYSISRIDGKKTLSIELPDRKRNYSFAILRGDADEETIVFMDVDEKITDTGLFGYVVMK